MKRLCLLVILSMSLTGLLYGQRTTASISGVVTDPSGAVIAKAKVTATNTGTQAMSTVESNADGFYLLGNLEPGTYKVDVQGVGFQGYEQTGITLQAGQPRTVNVPLVVGSATTWPSTCLFVRTASSD